MDAKGGYLARLSGSPDGQVRQLDAERLEHLICTASQRGDGSQLEFGYKTVYRYTKSGVN